MMKDKIEEKGIGEICTEAYILYGKYVNGFRALPYLMDGLKPSYRRIIYTAIKNGGKEVPTSDLVGNAMKIHPHGDKSIVGVINKLVRYGIFVEGGNFGYYPIYGESMEPAAPRYTETGITPDWYKMIGELLEYVPFIASEKQGQTEPEYIPTVFPLSLIYGSKGIGIGINSQTPSFSPQSLLEAYLNDDPSLLKPYYDLELDYENSDLEALWRTGKGKVNYKYRVYKDVSSDGSDGVYIEGDTHLFYPDFSQLLEWRDQGRIFLRDESSEGNNALFIGRNKGVRAVNQEMIYEECLRCTNTSNIYYPMNQVYKLGINDGKVARYIPMRDWIDTTYKNYVNLIESYKKAKTSQAEFEILVYTHLKSVAEILINSKDDVSNEAIAEKLGIDLDVVNAITRKSISTLKRVDTESKIESLHDSISWYKSINPEDRIKETISKI